MVKKETVALPISRMKLSIAEILVREGYLAGIDPKSKKTNTLEVSLSYKDGRPAISGVKRISKPSRRVYQGVRDLKPVKRGRGLLVLSTPAGILTGKDARAQNVGGEALFEIW